MAFLFLLNISEGEEGFSRGLLTSCSPRYALHVHGDLQLSGTDGKGSILRFAWLFSTNLTNPYFELDIVAFSSN